MGKIIPIHLFVFFFNIFDKVCFFFANFSCLISISALVYSTKNPNTDFFFISIFFVRDLFHIPIQSLCSLQEISSISSVRNFDVMYPSEFSGKETTTSVSSLSYCIGEILMFFWCVKLKKNKKKTGFLSALVFWHFFVPFNDNFAFHFFRWGVLCNFRNTIHILLIILYIKIITFSKNCFPVTPKVDILKIVMNAKLNLEVAGKKKIIAFWCMVHSLEEQILPCP